MSYLSTIKTIANAVKSSGQAFRRRPLGVFAALLLATVLCGSLATSSEAAPSWLGIDSTDLYSSDTHCDDEGGSYEIEDALDGNGQWRHNVDETHYFILDLGQSYTVSKVRGRSNGMADPTSANIYVSDNPASWGTAVATGVTVWEDNSDQAWDEVDTTDKDGRYVKVEITATEDGNPGGVTFGFTSGGYEIFDVYGEVASSEIAFDSASNSTPSDTNVNSDSWNHTTGSGLTNSILIIGVTWRNSTTNTYDVSSITYGGSSAGITLIRKDGQDGDGISRNVALYYLKNPGSGSNQIVVNFSGTVWVRQCGAVTLEGVDQTNPIDAHNGQVSDSEDPVNVSVTTTVNNNWVVDVVTVRDETGSGSDPAITADGSQTERFNRIHPGTDYALTSGMSTKGPNSSGSVAMEWDISVTSDKETAIAAVSLKPATPTAISSAANQTFTVGDGTTAISTITITDDATTATITATDDIRIRIPSGFNMVWDTDDATATIGGTDSDHVNPGVTFEDSNKTVVINVTTDFEAGDDITVSGLNFESFSAASSADNLELETENDGEVTATDDKTITINAAAAATISSVANQSFTVGDGTTAISTITITDDATTATITATDDIRIRIPSGFNMVWDTDDATATIGGTDSDHVNPGVTFEDSNKTVVINVTTDFEAGDDITVSGLNFESFSAASSADNLELETENDGAVTAYDDKTITINAAPASCAFAKYKKITIDAAEGAADLTDFPVMIMLTGDDLTELIDGVTDDDGDDIVFRDDLKGDQLDHEIEAYDDTSGEEIFVAWVKIPVLDASDPTDIYMYYGNDCIDDATDTQDAAGVWSNSYEAVYHLHDDVNDSTGSHNGTDYSAPDPAHVDDMDIAANAHDYESGDSSYTDIGTWSVSGSEITIQTWVEFESFPEQDTRMVAKATSTSTDDHVWMLSTISNSGYKMRFRLKCGTADGSGTETLIGHGATLATDTPYFAVVKYAGSDDTMRIRLCDAGTCSQVGSMTHGTASTSLRENSWGVALARNGQLNDKYLDGMLDEVRISSKARPDDWLDTEYNNQSDPASFLTVYGEQSAAATAVSLVSFSAKGAGNAVNVKWQTAREFDNLGFHLYRAQAPGGPYTRITEKLIPGFPQRGKGGSYSYTDANVSVGQLYYYKLKDIDIFGTHRVHGPICVDWDGDGMPDDWEIEHGLNPWVDDADLDPDGDGLTNLEEYLRGTDPFNPDSDGDGILDGDEDGRLEPAEDSGARQLTRGIEVLAQDESGMTLELITSGFEAEAVTVGAEEFEQLSITEYVHGFTSELGAPQLPLKGMLIDVPQGKVAQLTVLKREVEPYYGYRVYPVPEAVVDTQGTASAVGQQFVQDHVAYNVDDFYPQVAAELGASYVLRGQIKQQLVFYPISFNSASGQLNFYGRIRVRIDFIDAAYARIDSLYAAPWQPPQATAALLAPVAIGLAASPLLASPISPLLSSLGAAIAAVWSPPEDGGSAVYKIATSAGGIYRIDRAWLLAQGLDAADVGDIDLDAVRLFNLGVEVAVYIEDQAVAGQLDAGDYIEFYAVAVAAEYAKYSAENVYWLTFSGRAGLPKRMGTVNAAPIGGDLATDFADTARHEQDQMYWLKAPGADSLERWFLLPFVQGHEHAGNGAPVPFIVTVPDPVTTGTLKISMVGQTATEHTVEVVVNGQQDTYYWSDIAFTEAILTDVPLNPGNNTVTLQCLSADGNDSILVDFFEITYRRDYVAGADNTLKFAPDSGDRYVIEDFTSNSLLAYDISDPTDVAILDNVVISGANPYDIEFEPASLGDTYYVVASAAINNPDSLVVDSSSSLSDTDNSADYILITHRDIGWDGNGDAHEWLEDLAALRQAQGLRVFVADIEDIYDEFGYGIKTPTALKDFLSYAYSNWQAPAPGYVLLVGDSTYDFKDNWPGVDDTAYLPVYLIFTDHKGETVTDHWFVTISGDDAIADMHLGRLPAVDATDAADMVDKIITYETTANSKFIDPDPWEKNILLIADNQRAGEEYAYEAAFAAMNDAAAELLPAVMNPDMGYLGIHYATAPFLNDYIVSSLNTDGALMVNYSGHGATQIWATENIFDYGDAAALTNTGELPFFVSMSCETGFFAYPQSWPASTSLAEALLRSDAGAVAALMPTGMTTTPGQQILNNALFEAIFSDDVRTLGPAIAAAKQTLLANGDAYFDQIADTFILFGDPATILKVPLPYRPTGVSVERQARGKRISWNAATDCDGNAVAGYNIYRAATAAGPFSKLNTEWVTDTVFYDTGGAVGLAGGVGGGGAGYYVVTSVDSGGTESVSSLAVKPASMLSRAASTMTSGGSSAIGCFIATAGQPAAQPQLLFWVLLTITAALCVWGMTNGRGHRA